MPNPIASQNAGSPEDLKRVFETAVVEIRQGQAPKRHLPILQRSRPTTELSGPGAEKRALSDAARALAQLWNVSTFNAR